MRDELKAKREQLTNQVREIQQRMQQEQQAILDLATEINKIDGKLELLDELDASNTTS